MIRQSSAWGQFWFDLSAIHRVHGCAIFTPLCTHIPRPGHRGLFYSTWVRMTDKGPIYYAVDGDTMIGMLRDGLNKTNIGDIRMKFALVAVQAEDIIDRLERMP